MAWIAQLDLVAAANALVILITGLAVGLGLKRGTKAPAPPSGTVEVAGALVDSSSIKMLAAAIEAQNVERVQDREQAKHDRRLGHELVEAVQDLTKELSEIRDEMRLKRR